MRFLKIDTKTPFDEEAGFYEDKPPLLTHLTLEHAHVYMRFPSENLRLGRPCASLCVASC